MRDFRLSVIEDTGLDIDIINGQAVLLDEESQTTDQRAAVAVYAMKGTVPGAEDFGMSWADTYSRNTTSMQLSNEAQLQVQNYAGNSGNSVSLNSQYSTLLLQTSNKTSVLVMRG